MVKFQRHLQINMKIDIPIELVEQIIVEELTWDYKNLKPCKPPMFSFDPKEEKEKMKELKTALKRVLEYYGVKV